MSDVKYKHGYCSIQCQIKFLGYYQCERDQCDDERHMGYQRHCPTCDTLIDFAENKKSYTLFCNTMCALTYVHEHGKNRFEELIKEAYFVKCNGTKCLEYYNTYYGDYALGGYCSKLCRAIETKDHNITENVVRNVLIHSPEMGNILRMVL